MATFRTNTVTKLLDVLKFQRAEITSIYFFAVFTGLVQLSLPVGIQSIISFVLGGSISTSLVLLIIFVILGVLAAGLLQVAQMKITERIQQQLFVRYSFLYADTLPKLSMDEVNGYYLPELSNRFFDIVSLQKGISKILLDIPAASIQIIFGLILLSFYHPVFIFFGMLLLAVLFVILRQTGNKGLETSLQKSDYKYKVAGYLQEVARNIFSFKFSKDKAHHMEVTDEYVTGYITAATAHFRVLLTQYTTLIAFKVIIIASMLIVGSVLLVEQQLNIGQFIAAEIVIILVIESVEKLIVNLDKIYDILTSVEKINKLPEKPMEPSGSMTLEPGAGEGISIQVQNLYFSYQEKMVLNGLSFSVGKGEKVAITGNQGSGKSTMLKIISGLYSNYAGSITVNDFPLGNYNINSLRQHTGVQLATQGVFQGTIKENILMGKEPGDYAYLNELATITGLKPFIDSHREGYDFLLQPTGYHLPGKIIKKILLVRAMVHRPALLLLEEPWLGLEAEYITGIREYLLKLKDTTVIIVTNDPTYHSMCDKVINLENGIATPTKNS
jgi:ATP-binding cassette subfamily B protein